MINNLHSDSQTFQNKRFHLLKHRVFQLCLHEQVIIIFTLCFLMSCCIIHKCDSLIIKESNDRALTRELLEYIKTMELVRLGERIWIISTTVLVHILNCSILSICAALLWFTGYKHSKGETLRNYPSAQGITLGRLKPSRTKSGQGFQG